VPVLVLLLFGALKALPIGSSLKWASGVAKREWAEGVLSDGDS
jgi:hypothetical protein